MSCRGDSNETAVLVLAFMAKFFLALIVAALVLLMAAFILAVFRLQNIALVILTSYHLNDFVRAASWA